MIDILMYLCPLFVCLVTIPLGAMNASLFEWTLHRYVMHKSRKCRWKWLEQKLNYAFKSHALIHHGQFGADNTYHAGHNNDPKKIPMAWWNGPILIFFASIPFLIVSIITHYWWSIWVTSLVVISLYFVAYEYLHWCMHKPKERAWENGKIFRYLNGHHTLHHHAMHRNFNVVWDFADRLLGTKEVVARRAFKQPPAPVPNVQPRHVEQKVAA